MRYLTTGYDSEVFRDGEDCIKIYKTCFRWLDGTVLYDYHEIQSLMSRAVGGIIRGNVGDIGCEYHSFDFSLEVLRLKPGSISSHNGVYSSRLPFIEGTPLEEIKCGEAIIPALLNAVNLDSVLREPLMESLIDGNVKVLETGNRKGRLVVTDLAAQIQPYCQVFNEHYRGKVEQYLRNSGKKITGGNILC